MQNRKLSFKNGKFKVMQIADTQEIYPASPDTVRLIEAALDAERPDLVVFTGDQVKGYSPKFKSGKGAKLIEETIEKLISPLEKRNIPFAVTFGNHDCQGALSNYEQFEIYKKSAEFVYSDFAGEGDCGTFCLEIDGDEKPSVLLYLFDTHSNAPEGGYDSVNREQMEWYKKTRDKYEAENGAVLPSFAFQHIPAPEYYDVLKRVKRFTKGAVRAFGDHENEFYILNPQNSRAGDFMGESPASPYTNRGQVDAFLEKKDVKALFVGHDHNNSFVADYKGLSLVYTQGAGFNVYGPGLERGVRIIDISSDGEWDTHTLTFSTLLGNNIINKGTFYFFKYCPSSVASVKATLKETGAVLAAVSSAAALVYAIKKKISNK